MAVTFEQIKKAADFIESSLGTAKIGIVLGSGLGNYADSLSQGKYVNYADIPNFPTSTVPGHAGKWWAGSLSGKKVFMLQGRVHSYEGYSLDLVTMYVRVMKLLGVDTLILTNAAGCVNTSWNAGDLMLISDFINLSGKNSLTGPNMDEFGVRFPDMSRAYSRELREKCANAAEKCGISLRSGVYAWMNGPCYESPAEIRMARIVGADAVGMSTVPETIVANHCGISTLGISCLTNMAAGILPQPLSHEEVQSVANKVQDTFQQLLTEFVGEL